VQNEEGKQVGSIEGINKLTGSLAVVLSRIQKYEAKMKGSQLKSEHIGGLIWRRFSGV
jgi:hypothetical protein